MTNETITKRVHALLSVINPRSNATEGERTNAESLLDKLLKKHKLTLDDFKQDQQQKYRFTYKVKYEERLLFHIVAKVKGMTESPQAWGRGKSISFMLTKAEYEDVKQMYKAFRPALAETLEMAFVAFLGAQDLAVKKDACELSMDELIRARKVARMGQNIKRVEGLNRRLLEE